MALVWPGAGQCLQKRWLAGTIYAVGFLLTVIAAFAYGIRILSAWYSLIEGDITETNILRMHAWKMLLFFLLSIILWIVSIVDMCAVHVARRRKELQEPGLPGPGEDVRRSRS